MSIRPVAILVAAGLCSLAAGAFAQSAGEVEYWLNLRKNLVNDSTYLDQIRDTPLPSMEGIIVSMEPAIRPHTLLIGIETPLVAELRLEIQRDGQDARMHTTPARKSKIRFNLALPKSVRKQPFVLTAIIDEMSLDYEQDDQGVGPQ